jgi:hypothetical protein
LISNDLAGISDWIAGHAAKGDSLGPKVSADLALQLMDIAERVRVLEGQPVPMDLRSAAP